MFKGAQKTTHLPHTKKVPCSSCHIYILTLYKACIYCYGTGVEFSTQNICTTYLALGWILRRSFMDLNPFRMEM